MSLIYAWVDFPSPTLRALRKVLELLGITVREIRQRDVPGTRNYVLIPPSLYRSGELPELHPGFSPKQTAVLARRSLPIRNQFLSYHPGGPIAPEFDRECSSLGLRVVTDLPSALAACFESPRPLTEVEIRSITEDALASDVRWLLHELKHRSDNAIVQAAFDCIQRAAQSGLLELPSTSLRELSISELQRLLASLRAGVTEPPGEGR